MAIPSQPSFFPTSFPTYSPTDLSSSAKNSLSAGAVAGIVGVVGFAFLITFALMYYFIKMFDLFDTEGKSEKKRESEMTTSVTANPLTNADVEINAAVHMPEKDKNMKSVEITSTNDLTYPTFNPFLQFVGLAIISIQICIMIYLCIENFTTTTPFKSAPFRLGQIFAFFYLIATVPQKLSLTHKLTMRSQSIRPFACCEDKEIRKSDPRETMEEIKNRLDKLEDGIDLRSSEMRWTQEPWKILSDGRGNLLTIILLVFVTIGNGFYSLFYLLPIYFIRELLGYNEKCPKKFVNTIIRSLALIAESVLLISSIVAVIFTINSQDTLIGLLTNFYGVVIVLDLDDYLMEVFPKTEIMLPKRWVERKDQRPNFTEPSPEFGTFIVCGIVVTASMLYTVKW
jgi:magnesium-transporting ATPase (P-type)